MNREREKKGFFLLLLPISRIRTRRVGILVELMLLILNRSE